MRENHLRRAPRSNNGRPNNNGGGQNNNSSMRRPSQNNVPNRNQVFDSNGPDVRIRGNAYQLYEKYQSLARDAHSAGDRVKAESCLQHAEHYFRIMLAIQEAMGEAYRSRNPMDGMDNQQQDYGTAQDMGNDGYEDQAPSATPAMQQQHQQPVAAPQQPHPAQQRRQYTPRAHHQPQAQPQPHQQPAHPQAQAPSPMPATAPAMPAAVMMDPARMPQPSTEPLDLTQQPESAPL